MLSKNKDLLDFVTLRVRSVYLFDLHSSVLVAWGRNPRRAVQASDETSEDMHLRLYGTSPANPSGLVASPLEVSWSTSNLSVEAGRFAHQGVGGDREMGR